MWLTEDNEPMIFYNNTWSPICGHYFWDNNYGANIFCQKLGYTNGTVSPKKEDRHLGVYLQDSLRVGKCRSSNSYLTSCSGGCNDLKIGGVCYENEEANCTAGQAVKITITCYGGSTTEKTSTCTSTFLTLLTVYTHPTAMSARQVF